MRLNRYLLPGCLVMLGLLGPLELAGAEPASDPPAAQELPSGQPSTNTILLAGQVNTWLDLAEPPYNLPVTLKMKLERVGFRVVLDPGQPHDVVLVIDYRESRGRQYQRLEHGTQITCTLALHRAEPPNTEPMLTYRFEAATNWPTPVVSLYWDAVQNLEENAYYYYIGELLRGYLTAGQNAVAVFSEVIQEPPVLFSTHGGGRPPTGREVANQEARLNAIRELGRLKDRQALPALWALIEQPDPAERATAVAAIGTIGDPGALDRLRKLYETDPDLRAAAAQATQGIQHSQ